MFDDKRKFMRFDMPLNVQMGNTADAANSLCATTKDFSREGLSVYAHNFNYEPNDTLQLKMEVPLRQDMAELVGQVMWKKQVEGGWHAGLKFCQINKETKMDILEFAYDEWLNKLRNQNNA
jgi:hypothetical protein